MLPYPVQQPVEHFEISPRFRHMLECRIERLESDAAGDEVCAALLDNPDHMRRHLRLVAVQRAEAMRMRVFLERAQTRLPRPLIAL
ncbi:MAG TPA: hypothetical protein VF392_13000 [Terracidiphilus sp.]